MERVKIVLLTAAILLSAMTPQAHCAQSLEGTPWLGAAFSGNKSNLEAFAKNGGKIIRLYGEEDVWVLDEAAKLGLKVVMGVWLEHPRRGFNLDDPKAVEEQNARIRDFVTQYRNHPALLAWGIGNEVELLQSDPRPAWRLVNNTAAMVKAIDPEHPTIMIVANMGDEHLKILADHSQHADIIGINTYGDGLYGLPDRLQKAGIHKPVAITEFGPLGQWDAAKKAWGAPLELTGSQKAKFFKDAMAFIKESPQLVGGFAFVWGTKQEQTETWHSLLLKDGSLTPMTDALLESWGQAVVNKAPEIRHARINADKHHSGDDIIAHVDAIDPEGHALTTEWIVRKESTDLKKGGDIESIPEQIPVHVRHNSVKQLTFISPPSGAYRLFITVRDPYGKADTANLPFLVSDHETN
ncbi:hypothetical protein HEQ60_00680 [Haematospirillum sp. H1815]|uniref:glycoside hydrolase family 2 TIM barrel-domain containing protein n=1 Tax=Haematospirillum sp. H1815 TaxID=2723108 RepID=UPI00143972C6|nr:glycoside hydrolase family 2 TIM barrel-domain containing protein [Haematospirillum sp. H1815]NKD76291.1 hypothetical protein [Haematospirillum sp. H1815]